MPEVALTIYDVETGEEERINIDSRRFSIGRLPENDLAIEDTNFSRRHALIEIVDRSIIVSDCGSQNGTFVNGRQVVGAVELHDGDVLTFGGSKEITVEISTENAPGISYGSGASIPAPASTQKDKAGPVLTSVPPWLNAPVLAGAAVVLILLGAGLLLALNKSRDSAQRVPYTQPTVPSESSPVVETNPQVEPSIVAETPQENKIESDDKANELRIIDKHARTVMSSISNDSSPVLKSDVVAEISKRVKTYADSSVLREQLRAINQRGLAQLSETAKVNGIKLPLAILAALAKMDRDGQRGDPISVAQNLMPTLRTLRGAFGTELANDSLLIVATIDQPHSGSFHPLQLTAAKLAKENRESPNKIRTVWYLHEHQKLSSEAYDLVLRFLAIGVIAQEPRRFGVDAEPLVF